MKKFVPHYYTKFRCIASECKDNCCFGGWQIDIDEETANQYLTQPGPFGEQLKRSLSKSEDGNYCFVLEHGACPFLDENRLCQIVKTLGSDHIGVVCTQFPRYTEYFGNIKESGIGLACEEAARIIMTDTQPFGLTCIMDEEEPVTDSEFDEELSVHLFPLRGQLIQLFERNDLSLFEKLAALFIVCERAQKSINENKYECISKLYEQIQDSLTVGIFNEIKEFSEQELTQGIIQIFTVYEQLEPLSDEWVNLLAKQKDSLCATDAKIKSYTLQMSGYLAHTKPLSSQWNHLIEYFIYRYFMKATYDHDVIGKAQFMISACEILMHLELESWVCNEEQFSFDDRMELLHLFSREIEYDEENLEALTEEFLFEDIFHGESMIALLATQFRVDKGNI